MSLLWARSLSMRPTPSMMTSSINHHPSFEPRLVSAAQHEAAETLQLLTPRHRRDHVLVGVDVLNNLQFFGNLLRALDVALREPMASPPRCAITSTSTLCFLEKPLSCAMKIGIGSSESTGSAILIGSAEAWFASEPSRAIIATATRLMVCPPLAVSIGSSISRRSALEIASAMSWVTSSMVCRPARQIFTGCRAGSGSPYRMRPAGQKSSAGRSR